jgi:hypothetical protein
MRTPSTPSGSRDLRDLRSLPVVMVLVLLYYILYYYYSSTRRGWKGCAHAQQEVAQYPPKWGLLIGNDVTRRASPGKYQGNPLRVTFDDVTSSEKAPLGQILRNFPLRMRTPSTPSGSRDLRDLRSLPVVMVLVLLYYILYYYYSSSTKCPEVTWSALTGSDVIHVTGSDVTESHITGRGPPQNRKTKFIRICHLGKIMF